MVKPLRLPPYHQWVSGCLITMNGFYIGRKEHEIREEQVWDEEVVIAQLSHQRLNPAPPAPDLVQALLQRGLAQLPRGAAIV